MISQPTVFQAPVGLELTDREFLENKFQEYVEKAGGLENFKNQLRLSFLNEHGSFAILFQASMNEIIDLFYNFCTAKYKPDVDGKDVLDELLLKDRKQSRKLLPRLFLKVMAGSRWKARLMNLYRGLR